MSGLKGITAGVHIRRLDSSTCSSQVVYVNWEMAYTRRRLLLQASLAAAAAALAASAPLEAHAQSAVQRTQQEYDGYAGEQRLKRFSGHAPCVM